MHRHGTGSRSYGHARRKGGDPTMEVSPEKIRKLLRNHVATIPGDA